MSLLRCRAVWLTAGVLLVQVAAFAGLAVTTAFCCRPARAASATGLPDCCKGDGHACPLMKQAMPDSAGPAMKSCGFDERIASLLFGNRGMLAIRTTPIAPPSADASHAAVQLADVDWTARVHTPPPRA